MEKFGKIGVTLALSLIMSVALFTSGVFAQNVGHSQKSAGTHLAMGTEMLAMANVMHQSFNVQQVNEQQPSYQQIHYERSTQKQDACNRQSGCQSASRCIRIFRRAWGWMFICRGW